jgi:hypothetical protein
MLKLIEKNIREDLNLNPLWKPGVTPIIDLRTFMFCVSEDVNGEKAKKIFYQYENDFNLNKEKYITTSPILQMKKAYDFLSFAQKEMNAIDNKKILAYECSGFSYSAISEAILNDNIRKNYDILQVGTMELYGRYLHNIAVLIPKGIKLTHNNQLPKGSLIIDPWARALGYPPETTLGVSPDKFEFKARLYPIKVNYNSAEEIDFEKSVKKFLADFRDDDFKDFTQKRAIIMGTVEDKEVIIEQTRTFNR